MLCDHFPLRSRLIALVLDLPRFLWTTRSSPRTEVKPWVFTRNRRERLLLAPDGRGVRCDWMWVSQINLVRMFPRLGLRLMKRSLEDRRIRFQDGPPEMRGDVEVSFVIGHRGLERLPNLLLVLRTIAAQQGAAVECIVVEQSASPDVRDSALR